MVNLTRKDLFHQKGKLVLIIIGLFSSVFLIQFSFGMYFGAIRDYSKMANEYGHEAWVTYEDMEMLMASGIIDDSIYEDINDIKGVKEADRIIYIGGEIEGEETVKYIQLIGFDLSSDIMPWDEAPSDYDELLDEENTIIIDESIKDTFPDLKKGDKLNFQNVVEYKIVGFSSGGLLMGTPFGWTSLKTAKNLLPWAGNFSTAIGIKFDSGYTFEEFKEDTKDIEGISVYTSTEIVDNTDDFIMNKMGVGMLIFLMAGMGLVVGLIIVSLTVYQSVLEKIPMFGTLKAIGAEKSFIDKMLYGQVFFLMTVCFILGTFMAMGASSPSMQITVDPIFSVILYFVMIGTSFLCAYASIQKVHKIDPAVVFRR